METDYYCPTEDISFHLDGVSLALSLACLGALYRCLVALLPDKDLQ